MAGETNFEGIDHAHLKAMVKDTDPAMVLSRGTQLQSAGRVLKELGDALKSHIGNVHWEGPAAEGFKTWAGNLQQSAALLGGYSADAGDAMHQAGEALSTAKAAVPDPPQTEISTVAQRNSQTVYIPSSVQLAVGQSVDDYMSSVDKKWVTGAAAAQAEAKIKQEHQEAVLQMEKLAQAYTAATTKLSSLDSDLVLPGTPGSDRNRGGDSEYTGGGSGGGYGGSTRSPRISGGSAGGSYGTPVVHYNGGSVTPRDPGTGPQGSNDPGRTSPIPPHGGQVPPSPQDPGSSVPPPHSSDPVNRPGTGLDSLPTVPTLPGQTGSGGSLPPGGQGTVPFHPGGTDGPGSTPGLPGGGPIVGFPGGAGGGSVSAKGSGGGYLPGKGGSVPPRGVPFGGGQISGKSGTPGLPSGTVFGAREAAPGAAGGRVGSANGMGGMHPGMGGAHGIGGSGGSARGGRGLTSTTGGTVGGRKGPAASGEFTPGGTGLRNRAAAAEAAEGGTHSRQNGMMAPGMAGHGGRNERDRRKRADYLHEDEETWTSGTPHSNPDVVE